MPPSQMLDGSPRHLWSEEASSSGRGDAPMTSNGDHNDILYDVLYDRAAGDSVAWWYTYSSIWIEACHERLDSKVSMIVQ